MALPQESQGLIEKWAEQHGSRLIFTGVGLINAAAKTTESIAKFRPQFVLNLGTAGSRQFSPHVLLECTEFLRRDQTLSFLNRKISSTAFSKLPKTNCGSADFVDMSENVNRFGVVDMEAYAIASVCKDLQVQFGVIKFVTDVSDHDVKKQWEKNSKAASLALLQFLSELFPT